VPKFLEKKNKNIVWFGVDNMYPYELIDLYNDSSTHNAIINGKVGYTVGNGLEGEDLETKKWLSQANIDQDWTSLMKSLSLDYEIFNGYAIEVIRTKVGNQYHHIDFANIRVGLDGSIQYADDWITDKGLKNSKPHIQYLERYNPRDLEQKRGVIYHVDYRPNLKYYPLPVYVGSLAEIKTDVQIGDYWLNEVENGFVGGTLIQHNNGVPETKEEAEKFEKAFQEKFGKATGTKIVHLFSPAKDNSSEITSLNGNDLHERYIEMSKRVKESIFIGHRVTNPILFGVKEEGQLGARNELDLAYEIFTNTYIAERQNTLLRTIKKLAFYEIQRTDIEIIPLKPIDVIDLTSDIILANLDRGEIRELIKDQTGLELQEEMSAENTQNFVEPRAGEEHDPFMNRCIAKLVGEEGYEADQASAICHTYWEDVHGETEMSDFQENDKEMVDGIIELLLKVEDLENRKKMVLDTLRDFDEEGVIYDREDFLNRVGVNLEGFNSVTKFDTYNDYPKAASRNAQTALNWAEKNGWGSCGTPVGKKRANQLANGDNISRDTIARMAAFERHRQNSKKKLGDGCGRLMWLAWGGDEGIAWAQRKLKQIDAEKMSACCEFSNDKNLSYLFKDIGVPAKDYDIVDKFDIYFDDDGSPMEFATKEQGLLQKVIKMIQDNPLISGVSLAQALKLTFKQLIDSINILTSADIVKVDKSEIVLTELGGRIGKNIDLPQIEVKYKYELRENAPELKKDPETGETIGKTREFCQDLLDLDLLYTKEAIEGMRNEMAESDIDEDITNVWLSRGGWYRKPDTTTSIPYCRHIWKQVLVRKK
jgi:hypothetical protein